MNTIESIEKIIDWYSLNYKKATGTQLMDAKTKLVTLLASLTDEVAESKKDSLITTVYRKYEHHKMKSQLIDDGFTGALAESKSIESAKKLMEEEVMTEQIAYLHKLKLSQYNRIVDDLTQRLAFMRDDSNYHKSIN